MKEKLGNLFKRFGHVIVDPVLYLAVIGIVLAISSLCSLGSGFIYHIYELLNAAANSAVLGNLPVILCVGLTAGFAKKQKANAAVLGLISYLMYVYINNAYLTMTNQLAVDGSGVVTQEIGDVDVATHILLCRVVLELDIFPIDVAVDGYFHISYCFT